MKRIGYLFEKICAFDNLVLASHKAFRGKKHKPHIAQFYFHLEPELCLLQEELLRGIYQPRPHYTFFIRDPKPRQICAADFRDRIVHHAICNILDPIFERLFIHDNYACRREKGMHKALKKAYYLTRQHAYFLKSDISRFFSSIDQDILKNLLGKKFKDPQLEALFHVIIAQPCPGSLPGKGLPIGNLTSQYFANYYLTLLDLFVKEQLGVKHYLRYMDDFLLFADDKETLHRWKGQIRDYLDQTLKLSLKEKGTFLSPVKQGVPFLGFRLFPGVIRLKRANLIRFKRQIRLREQQFLTGHVAEKSFIQSVQSLVGHIRHGHTHQFRHHFFDSNGIMESG